MITVITDRQHIKTLHRQSFRQTIFSRRQFQGWTADNIARQINDKVLIV